jgi:hypothetical protein
VIVMTVAGAFGNAALAAVPPVLIGLAFRAISQTPPDFARLKWAAAWIVISQIARAFLQLGRNSAVKSSASTWNATREPNCTPACSARA